MPKMDTIQAICGLNPAAEPGFLNEFSEDELSRYLDRLQSAHRRDSTPPSKEGFDYDETGSPEGQFAGAA